jgi:hypothetical protein
VGEYLTFFSVLAIRAVCLTFERDPSVDDDAVAQFSNAVRFTIVSEKISSLEIN